VKSKKVKSRKEKYVFAIIPKINVQNYTSKIKWALRPH
jgi:hypothetical protein